MKVISLAYAYTHLHTSAKAAEWPTRDLQVRICSIRDESPRLTVPTVAQAASFPSFVRPLVANIRSIIGDIHYHIGSAQQILEEKYDLAECMITQLESRVDQRNIAINQPDQYGDRMDGVLYTVEESTWTLGQAVREDIRLGRQTLDSLVGRFAGPVVVQSWAEDIDEIVLGMKALKI